MLNTEIKETLKHLYNVSVNKQFCRNSTQSCKFKYANHLCAVKGFRVYTKCTGYQTRKHQKIIQKTLIKPNHVSLELYNLFVLIIIWEFEHSI